MHHKQTCAGKDSIKNSSKNKAQWLTDKCAGKNKRDLTNHPRGTFIKCPIIHKWGLWLNSLNHGYIGPHLNLTCAIMIALCYFRREDENAGTTKKKSTSTSFEELNDLESSTRVYQIHNYDIRFSFHFNHKLGSHKISQNCWTGIWITDGFWT